MEVSIEEGKEGDRWKDENRRSTCLAEAMATRARASTRFACAKRTVPIRGKRLKTAAAALQTAERTRDPWTDAEWKDVPWTVFRGQAYDLRPFLKRHPGGSWLLTLAIGRDCTALFESTHLRPEVAVAHLQRLPVLEDFPVDQVPATLRPNDSKLYNRIRERVRNEVFPGNEAAGKHRTGSEAAAATIIGFAVFAYAVYLSQPSFLTGGLLGLAGAWIGLTVQHCGNHGAMSRHAPVNLFMGLLSDLVGGSSLAWRYHHQVSHHIHCNDAAIDEDVHSAFPILRFDAQLPKYWYHKFQHIYMWFVFPLMTMTFHLGDLDLFFSGETKGAVAHGMKAWEKASIVLGKVLHFGLLLALPTVLHGNFPHVLLSAAGYLAVQSVVLASTFAVSHNVSEAKEWPNFSEEEKQDWGIQQVLTSANWGGAVGNFFTGGLNLQIEHHLFPAVSFVHYPAIAKIVEEECKRADIPYGHYATLPEILGRYVQFMKEVGSAPENNSEFLINKDGTGTLRSTA